MELTKVIAGIRESKEPLLAAIFELNQASSEIDSLRKDVKFEQAIVASCRKEISELQHKIQELNKEISILKDENKKLQAEE